MKHAVIIDGVVDTVVIWDGQSNWAPKIGQVVLCGDEVGFGWTYTAGTFAPPTPAAEPRRLVPKSLMVARLQAQGKLDAAFAILQSNTYAWARWLAADWPSIYFDDPEAVVLLNAVGADVAVVMAP